MAYDVEQAALRRSREPERCGARRGPRERALVLVHRPAVVDEQSGAIEDGDDLGLLFADNALVDELRLDLARDAEAGRAGAEDDDALRGKPLALDRQGAVQARHHDGARSLYIVVERRHDARVAIEDRERVVLAEILPLHERARHRGSHCGDELVDEREVLQPADAARGPAQVLIVGEQLFVVGAEVEAHGDRLGRVDAGGRGVQGELALRDRHAACALVADAENRLVVGDDEQPYLAGADDAPKHGFHAALHVRRDPNAAAALEYLTEFLHCRADRRRVDDRHQLFEVVGEHAIVKMHVAIEQRVQHHVLLQVVGRAGELLIDSLGLLALILGADGQQALEPERLPFLDRKPRAFVQAPGCGSVPSRAPRS